MQSKLDKQFNSACEIITYRIGYYNSLAYTLSIMKPKFENTAQIGKHKVEVDSICISTTGINNTVTINREWYNEYCRTTTELAVYLLHAIVKDSLLWLIPILIQSLSIHREGSWCGSSNIFTVFNKSNKQAFNNAVNTVPTYGIYETYTNTTRDDIEVDSYNTALNMLYSPLSLSEEDTTTPSGIAPISTSMAEADREIINFLLDCITVRSVKVALPDAAKMYHRYFLDEKYPECILRRTMPLHPVVRMFMTAFGSSQDKNITTRNSVRYGILPYLTYEDMILAIDTLRANSDMSIDIRFAATFIGCFHAFSSWGVKHGSYSFNLSSVRKNSNVTRTPHAGATDLNDNINKVIRALSTSKAILQWPELANDPITNITIPKWETAKTIGINLSKIEITDNQEWIENLTTTDHTNKSIAAEILTDILSVVPSPKNSHFSTSIGFGSTMITNILKVTKSINDKETENIFTNAINAISRCKKIIGKILGRETKYTGVIPTADRRAAYSVLAGIYPVFFDNTMMNLSEKHGEVAVYIDVSGSMGDYISAVYGICIGLSDYLQSHIYLYSNSIGHITLDKLKSGVVESTTGTDFDCVLTHISKLPCSISKIVVFTDGYWNYNDKSVKLLQNCGKSTTFFFICTPHGTQDNMQKLPFPKNITVMKGLKTNE